MLTAKYRLHFANGKDHIKEERLRPYDRAKHEIYKALKEELLKAQNWDELKDVLADKDIDMKFKISRTTREIQGVKFEYNGFCVNISERDLDCYIRFWAYSNGVGNVPTGPSSSCAVTSRRTKKKA